MHLGQTMLTLAALVLLSLSVLNTNRMIVESDQQMYEGESLDLAVNFAEALLDEISMKKFDSNVNEFDTTYQAAEEFTPVVSLGPGGGETISPWPDTTSSDTTGTLAKYKSISTYDDIDDYDGYERVVNTARITGFQVTSEVFYVTDANPNDPASVQTYFKKIIVNIEHPNYLNRVTFSTIASY